MIHLQKKNTNGCSKTKLFLISYNKKYKYTNNPYHFPGRRRIKIKMHYMVISIITYLTSGFIQMFLTSVKPQIPTAAPTAIKRG